MPHPTNHARARRRGLPAGTVAILLAASAAAVVVATAAASSFTLRVAKNVHVTNTPTKAFRAVAVDKHEAVAVGPNGFAVYTFQGEFVHGASRHLICKKTTSPATNCWAFWPPVTPSSVKHLTKPPTITGKLATFLNHGIRQLTLNGRPLYYFSIDLKTHNKRMAVGDELKTFGSIWHVVVAHVPGSGGQGSPTTTGTMTTTTPGYTPTSPTQTNPPPGY